MSAKGVPSTPDARAAEERARRRHLRRAGVAGIFAVALVSGLLLWEEGAEEVRAPASASRETAAPDTPASSARPLATPATPAVEAEDLPTLASPPDTVEPTNGAGTPVAEPDEPSPQRDPAVVPAEPARAQPPAAPALPPGTGFTVQPSAFGGAEAAGRLHGELSAQGYPAYVQSRVMVGPFADRGTAEATRAKLQRATKLEGVLAAAGGKHVIQLGVFSAADNAQRLEAELARQGFPVLVQSRVIVGPFADRKSAESARDELRETGALEGRVVPPAR